MTDTIPNARESFKVPILGYDEKEAIRAWNRYSALKRAKNDDPSLGDDIAFQTLLDEAYAAFCTAFDGVIP